MYYLPVVDLTEKALEETFFHLFTGEEFPLPINISQLYLAYRVEWDDFILAYEKDLDALGALPVADMEGYFLDYEEEDIPEMVIYDVLSELESYACKGYLGEMDVMTGIY